MLRLNSRSRNKNMKNNHSKTFKKNAQEKSNYKEDYNEIILNDLVPQENKQDFGLDNEHSSKKQGGLKLKFALGNKKRPNKKHHNQDNLDIVENVHNNKQKVQEDIIETVNTKKSARPKRRPNQKKESKYNQETQENKKLKSKKSQSKNENNHKEQSGHNKSNQSEENQGKSSHGKKTNHKNESEKSSKKSNSKLKKFKNNDKKSKNGLQEKTKKRKRPHVQNEYLEEEVRNLEAVEPEIDIEVNEEDSQDMITFRGDECIEENNNQEQSQEKASEIKELQSKFENIVWSEDKFPKN